MSILFGVEQLRSLAIQLAMDELFGDDLPMAAAHALARGVDSRSLRELAGLSKGQSRDAVDLFRLAMDELGSPVPDKSGARLHLMREAAASIVAGNGDPEDLAHEIYWQASHSRRPEVRAVGDRFLELYAGWGATYDQAEAAVAAMQAAARSFLRDHGRSPDLSGTWLLTCRASAPAGWAGRGSSASRSGVAPTP